MLRERFADAETPVGIYRKLGAGRPGTFLLESAEQGGIWSRWSFVGVGGFGVLTQDENATVWLPGSIDAERALGDAVSLPPLEALDAVYRRWATPAGRGSSAAHRRPRRIHRLGRPSGSSSTCRTARRSTTRLPGQAFVLVSELVALDHRFGTVTLIAAALGDDPDADPDALWADAQARLDALEADLARPSIPDVASIDLTIPPTSRPRGTRRTTRPRSCGRRSSSATATCSRW